MTGNRRIVLFFLFILLGFAGLYFYKKYRIAPELPLLTMQLTDAEDHTSILKDNVGKPMIISYYASWCGDCLKEMKDLSSVCDTALKGIDIICITDEPAEKLISFTSKHNYSYQFYRINKSFNELGINAIPVTYFINTRGEMVYNKVGAIRWKDQSFIEYTKKLLLQ